MAGGDDNYTFASLQKQRRSREVWYRHVYSQLKASSDRAI
jgi:hypothetical protein